MPIHKPDLIQGTNQASPLELGHAEKVHYRASTLQSSPGKPDCYTAFENLVPSTQKSKREPFVKLKEALRAKLTMPGGRPEIALYTPSGACATHGNDDKYHGLQAFLKKKFTTFHEVLANSSAILKQLVFTELKRPLKDEEDAELSLDVDPVTRLCLLPPPCGAHLAHSVANCLRLWQTHLCGIHMNCKEILFEYTGEHAFYPQSVKRNFEKLEDKWERTKENERKAHEALVEWQTARKLRDDADGPECEKKTDELLFAYKKAAKEVLALYRVRMPRKLADRARESAQEILSNLAGLGEETRQLAQGVGAELLKSANLLDKEESRPALVSIRNPDLAQQDYTLPLSEGGGDDESFGLDLSHPFQLSMWEYLVSCVQIRKTVEEILDLINNHDLLGVDLIPRVCSHIHNFCARTSRLFSTSEDVFGSASEKKLLLRDLGISLEYSDTIRSAAHSAKFEPILIKPPGENEQEPEDEDVQLACDEEQPVSPMPRTAGRRQIKAPFTSQEISHFLSTGHQEFCHDMHVMYKVTIEKLQEKLQYTERALQMEKDSHLKSRQYYDDKNLELFNARQSFIERLDKLKKQARHAPGATSEALEKAKESRDKYRLLFKHAKVNNRLAANKLETLGRELGQLREDARLYRRQTNRSTEDLFAEPHESFTDRERELKNLGIDEVETSDEEEFSAKQFFKIPQDCAPFPPSDEEGQESQGEPDQVEYSEEEEDEKTKPLNKSNKRKRVFSKPRKPRKPSKSSKPNKRKQSEESEADEEVEPVESDEETQVRPKQSKSKSEPSKRVRFDPEPQFKAPSPPRPKAVVMQVVEGQKLKRNDGEDELAPVSSTPRQFTTRKGRAQNAQNKPVTLLSLSYDQIKHKKTVAVSKHAPSPSGNDGKPAKDKQGAAEEVVEQRPGSPKKQRLTQVDSSNDEDSSSDSDPEERGGPGCRLTVSDEEKLQRAGKQVSDSESDSSDSD